ncbi:Fanconi anemia group M protein, partial [Temnothorax curvispinosus]|uniref:Fanconi anemia group M protein n=1 Tax=Temnothorax curvispinosus TaxID=300111 RepID=A0A6J1PGF3_9HYME
MESQNTVSRQSETKGFDLSAGNTWIYPENYPVRQYQYNIVQSALYRNTLVCLPTGLGKTFIAAVVMYNFWRWYPYGKIIFLAPTKPLVAQQIDACYEIMGIPSVDMIELTGAVSQKKREVAWRKKRIIFATPQVFHNDLDRSIIPSHLIKCVVIDEAHKALGKHSYCECIKILSTQNQYFRILALSATPGNKLDNVHEVIQNLHISHLELRDENSIDIIPYVNKRKVDIILVPLSDELAAFKERYITIMDRHVKFLIQCNVLRGHTANISKGRVFYLLKEFKTKTDKSGNYGQVMKILNMLLTMYHAYELMIRHGLRAFRKFYETHSDKFWMHSEDQLRDLLRDIEVYLGPFPELFPNGDVSEMPENIVFGHNKFHKLKELLEHHFNNNNSDREDTRAIVFVEYRDIVNEVYILLLQSKPIIRPQMFVGQAGQKQKQQIKALEDFRSNRVNVLISTSIGEEGLDVGEVDLIICFDVSQHSPIRLVQRMGRTGRKRDGHIIVLVTDGKEHENLKSTLSRRDSLNNKILNTSNIFSSLYDNNPRMIPDQFTPECHKIHITVLPKTPNLKGKGKRKNVNKKNEASDVKQKENLPKKDIGQPSMMKFLTDGKCDEQNRDNRC